MQILIPQEKNVNRLNRQDYRPPLARSLLSQILDDVASAHTKLSQPGALRSFKNSQAVERG